VEIKDGIHVVAEFEYDGTGRRILKAFDSDSPGSPDGIDTYQHIFLDGQQVIETRETASSTAQPETVQPKHQNIWSPRYIDSLILRDADADNNSETGDLGGTGSGLEQRVFYLADANYNVTALVDTNGDVLERYLYTPYGVVTILDADFTDDADGVSDYANTTLYTGREYNPETGIYYYRARYYHAELGKLIGRDLIVYADVNLYRYVSSNPVGNVDPSGTRAFVDKTKVQSKIRSVLSDSKGQHILALDPTHSKPAETGAFLFDNLADLLEKMGRLAAGKSGKKGKCIGVLEIRSHGNSEIMVFGAPDAPAIAETAGDWNYEDQGYTANALTTRNAQSIGRHLARFLGSPCLIILSSCNIGNRKETAAKRGLWPSIPQLLANGSGCTVIAAGGWNAGSFFGNNPTTKQLNVGDDPRRYLEKGAKPPSYHDVIKAKMDEVREDREISDEAAELLMSRHLEALANTDDSWPDTWYQFDPL